MAASSPPQGVLRDSPVPLHFQLRSLLLEMIERGEIGAGRPLPPERELAVQFGVSLAPVRQAILDLTREGLLYRVRGKGTFLHTPALVEHDAVLTSFTESMRAKGLPLEMRVLRNEKVAAPRRVAAALETAERKVALLERLAVVEGIPTALLTSYFSPRRFPRIGAHLAEQPSLYAVLESRFGVVPAQADTLVEVGRSTTAQSAVLGVAAGSPVLVATGTTYDSAGVPVEHFHVVYRSDRMRLRLETHRYVETVVSERVEGR
jgi:GntR family transcriptional regulator